MRRDGSESVFFKWLEVHTSIVKYIQIDASQQTHFPKSMTFAAYRDQVHQQRLAEINAFERDKFSPVVRSRTPTITFSPADRRSHPTATSFFHKLCFLEDKLFRFRSKQYTDSMGLINSLRELLSSKALLPDNYLIAVETDQLFDDILTEKPKLSAIKSVYRNLYRDFKAILGRCPSPEQQRKRMTTILAGVIQTVDPSMSFFPPSPLQESFDRLIFLPTS
jgi:hypothetical protein